MRARVPHRQYAQLIIGIWESLAQTIVSEIGIEVPSFPAGKNFYSRLVLAPHNDIFLVAKCCSHVMNWCRHQAANTR